MIIEGLFDLIFGFFELIISPINIPQAPEGLSEGFIKFIEYLRHGESFFNFVFPINMTPYFTIFMAIWSFHHVYNFAMFIVKKIPLFNMI